MPFIARRVSARTILGTVSSLDRAIQAGIPLVRALTLTAGSTKNRSMRHALHGFADALRRGQTLDKAIGPYRAFWGDELTAALGVGDASGKLQEVLPIMVDIYEHRVRTHRAVGQQLAYPATIIVCATVGIPYLKGYLTSLYLTNDKDYTLHFIMGLRQEAAFLLACWVAYTIIASIRPLRRGAGYLLSWIPPLSSLLRSFALARFFDALALLLTAGLSNARAVNHAVPFAANLRVERRLVALAGPLQNGSTLYAALSATRIVPVDVLGHIKVTEISGNVEQGLHDCAVQLTSGTRHAIEVAVSLIEATAILFIGFLIIAGLILS